MTLSLLPVSHYASLSYASSWVSGDSLPPSFLSPASSSLSGDSPSFLSRTMPVSLLCLSLAITYSRYTYIYLAIAVAHPCVFHIVPDSQAVLLFLDVAISHAFVYLSGAMPSTQPGCMLQSKLHLPSY